MPAIATATHTRIARTARARSPFFYVLAPRSARRARRPLPCRRRYTEAHFESCAASSHAAQYAPRPPQAQASRGGEHETTPLAPAALKGGSSVGGGGGAARRRAIQLIARATLLGPHEAKARVSVGARGGGDDEVAPWRPSIGEHEERFWYNGEEFTMALMRLCVLMVAVLQARVLVAAPSEIVVVFVFFSSWFRRVFL